MSYLAPNCAPLFNDANRSLPLDADDLSYLIETAKTEFLYDKKSPASPPAARIVQLLEYIVENYRGTTTKTYPGVDSPNSSEEPYLADDERTAAAVSRLPREILELKGLDFRTRNVSKPENGGSFCHQCYWILGHIGTRSDTGMHCDVWEKRQPSLLTQA